MSLLTDFLKNACLEFDEAAVAKVICDRFLEAAKGQVLRLTLEVKLDPKDRLAGSATEETKS